MGLWSHACTAFNQDYLPVSPPYAALVVECRAETGLPSLADEQLVEQELLVNGTNE